VATHPTPSTNPVLEAEGILQQHVEKLLSQQSALQTELKLIDRELGRVRSALSALRSEPTKSVKPRGPVAVRASRAGSVKSLVIELLAQSHEGLTPADLATRLVEAGDLEEGREGSIRTALWQLRRDGQITTDASGKSRTS
jgi:hypothetical protein